MLAVSTARGQDAAGAYQGAQPGSLEYDRPVPAGWRGAATLVFSRNAPVDHVPDCCENVWATYPMERHCFGDKCKRHQRCGCRACGMAAGPAVASGAGCATCGQAGGSTEGHAVHSAPQDASPDHAQNGVIRRQPLPAKVIEDSAPSQSVEPEAAAPSLGSDAAPIPGEMDATSTPMNPAPEAVDPLPPNEATEGSPAPTAEPTLNAAGDPSAPAEASASETDAQASEDLGTSAESASASETDAPADSAEPAPLELEPQDPQPAALPAEAGADAEVEESARVQGPQLFRVTRRPVTLQRIFRSR